VWFGAQTPFLFGSPCQLTDPYLLTLPTVDPLWTCGLRVTGNFSCPAGITFFKMLRMASSPNWLFKTAASSLNVVMPATLNMLNAFPHRVLYEAVCVQGALHRCRGWQQLELCPWLL